MWNKKKDTVELNAMKCGKIEDRLDNALLRMNKIAEKSNEQFHLLENRITALSFKDDALLAQTEAFKLILGDVVKAKEKLSAIEANLSSLTKKTQTMSVTFQAQLEALDTYKQITIQSRDDIATYQAEQRKKEKTVETLKTHNLIKLNDLLFEGFKLFVIVSVIALISYHQDESLLRKVLPEDQQDLLDKQGQTKVLKSTAA